MTMTYAHGDAVRPQPAPSVARMFLDRVAATPDLEAFRRPVDGDWESFTWRQTADQVQVLAAALLALGIHPEDRVAVICSTRYEWVLADLAVMCAGGATTTVYPTTMPEDVAYIVADSGSRIAVAEDDGQVAKLRAQRDGLPELAHVVVIDGEGDGDWVMSWAQLRALGEERLLADPRCVEQAVEKIRPDHLATLMYTSGTTGTPKGVELVQSCWTYEGAAAASVDLIRTDDVEYLWLPLSHSFGKVLLASQIQTGCTAAVDGRIDRIVENLAVVRPTLMAGAPRIFEKVHAKVWQTAHSEGALKARIFDWAFRVGVQVVRLRQDGHGPGPLLRAQYAVADRLVFRTIRARLGGRVRYLLSGSAALSRDIAEWFHAAGIVLVEGYGLTETSAGSTAGRPDQLAIGTVGPPLPGTDIRIADDGEILIHGPGVMRGYHGMAAETSAVLSADGWFATGDVGVLDDQGRLRITDRKKDLVKTSGGKYIAPTAIETQLKALCPVVSQVVVHADARKYAVALLTLDPDTSLQWAQSEGLTVTQYDELAAHPQLHEFVRGCVDLLNSRLNRWETVKDFRILDHDLSIEDGEITPSLKVRRSMVESMYRDLLDSMYPEEDTTVSR